MLEALLLFTGACLGLAVVIFVAACAWNIVVCGFVRIADFRHRCKVREEWALFYRGIRAENERLRR